MSMMLFSRSAIAARRSATIERSSTTSPFSLAHKPDLSRCGLRRATGSTSAGVLAAMGSGSFRSVDAKVVVRMGLAHQSNGPSSAQEVTVQSKDLGPSGQREASRCPDLMGELN